MTDGVDGEPSDGEESGAGDEEDSDLMTFLQKRGAVELMATVDTEGVRYKEMEESVGVSHDTLSKHLTQAEHLGLIETEQIHGERGRSHKYVLTPLGARIHLNLERKGAVNDYRLLQMYRQRTAEHEEDILEWIEEREAEGDLHDHSRNVSSLEMLAGTFAPDSPTEDDEE